MAIWICLALFVLLPMLLRVPLVSAVLHTVISLLLVIPLQLFPRRQLLPTPYRHLTTEQLAAEPGVSAVLCARLDKLSHQIREMGLDDAGVWISTMPPDGAVLSSVFLHPATESACIVHTTTMRGLTVFTAFEILSRRGDSLLATTSTESPTPTSGFEDDPEQWFMPSLRSPQLLWQAHQGRIASDRRPAVPLTEQATTFGAFLNAQRELAASKEIARGWTRPARPPHTGERTLRGSLAMLLPYLWPWKQAAERRLLAAEKQRLIDLGRLDLLDLAARALSAVEPQQLAGPIEDQFADDRGTPRRMTPPALLPSDERAGDRRFFLLHRWATELPAPHESTFGPIVGLGLLGCLALAFILAENWPFLVALGLLGVGLLGPIARGINSPSVIPAEITRARLLARGVCPCCLYSLAGLKPDPDGCTTCPECGSGWRADRIIECIQYGDTATADRITEAKGKLFRFGAATTGRPRQPAWRDDRGTRCVLTDPSLIVELTIGDLPGPASPMATSIHEAATALSYHNARAEAAAHQPQPRSWPVRLFRTFGIEGALLLPITLIVLWVSFWPPPAEIITGALIIAGVGILTLLISPLWRPWLHLPKPAQIRRVLLRHKLCPVCTTPLGHKPPQADGCTVCSCGAAWKLEPSASAQPV